MSASKTTPILIADDDENDVFFLRRALERVGVRNSLFVTRDGEEVIRYLAARPPYSDRVQFPLPGLLLLDLKMPRLNGFDVLSWISQRPELKELVIIVLSSSSHDDDVRKARELGAREFLTKPSDFEELVKLILELKKRWLERSVPAG